MEAVRWRWQAVVGVGASASHRRVDGKNGSKGLGETPCAGRAACAAVCGRCFFRGVLRGFQAKTTGGAVWQPPRRGRDLQDGRIGCRIGDGLVGPPVRGERERSHALGRHC
jgi:hypothetical protein